MVMDSHTIAAIIGTIVGIAGGVLGTYCGLKRANTQKQKALVITVSIVSWLGVLLLLYALLPYKAWLSLSQAVSQDYIPDAIEYVDMQCFKESTPVPWAYCVNRTQGSLSNDVLYYFHARNGNETWWNDREYHTGRLYQHWREADLDPPIVVSISFGKQWVLTEKPDNPLQGLFPQLVDSIIPAIEKKLAYPAGKRLLAGISMGGFNALIVAMKSRYFFHKVAALCAPLYDGSHHDGLLVAAEKYIGSGTSLKRTAMLWGFSKQYYPQLEDWKTNDPLALSGHFDSKGAPDIYLSCGEKDDWGCMQGSQLLVKNIKKNNGNIQWVPRMGGHCDIDSRSLALFLQ